MIQLRPPYGKRSSIDSAGFRFTWYSLNIFGVVVAYWLE